jgi:predicted GIY-YIG superfamily endonuclease
MNMLNFPYFVYTIVDRDGVVIYVGFTGNPRLRMSQHSRDKAWWGEVGSILLDEYPTEAAALEAERIAIRAGAAQVQRRTQCAVAKEGAGKAESSLTLPGRHL